MKETETELLESAETNAVQETGDIIEEKKEVEEKTSIKDSLAEEDIELLQILNAQNDILDCMLTQQHKIHSHVKERKWMELERCLNDMKAYSDAFVNLDSCRENFVGDKKSLYLSPKVEDVYVSVRTKLTRSKIENQALASYVESTKDFINGILDTCLPQTRNTLYNKAGRLVRPQAESVVLDTVM